MRTVTAPLAPEIGLWRAVVGSTQSLERYRMILFVPAILIAIAVLAWIAWLALGPRSVSVPPPQYFLGSSSETAPSGTAPGPLSAEDSTEELGAESDYQRHVRNRLEDSQVPLGSVSGVSGPAGLRAIARDQVGRGQGRVE